MEKLLAKLLVDAELAHAEYEREKLGGKHDDQWAGWYAAYMTKKLTEKGYLIHKH